MCGITCTVAPRYSPRRSFAITCRVDLAGREIAGAARARAHEALVVAQIEVGLRAVVGDVHLAVLKRAHRARVDVDVGIELHQPDLQAARLEDRAEAGRGNALAERGNDPARDEDESRHVKTGRTGARSRGSTIRPSKLGAGCIGTELQSTKSGSRSPVPRAPMRRKRGHCAFRELASPLPKCSGESGMSPFS